MTDTADVNAEEQAKQRAGCIVLTIGAAIGFLGGVLVGAPLIVWALSILAARLR